MDSPLLSVIVPVYNSKPYLATLIEAFCHQSESDFELVFVDDGSTDGSYEELCRLTADSALAVILHKQANGGVSAARNQGAKLANGEYFSFVDSDDTVGPDYVHTLKEQASSKPEVVVFRSLRIAEDKPSVPQVYEDGITVLSPTDMMERFIANPTALSMCNVFVRRDLYEDNGLTFQSGYPYYEDYDALYRLLAAAQTITIVERDLYFYIQRPHSAMARFTVERLSCMELMERLVPVLENRVPDFVPTFNKWMIPRLCWSVMWQAGLAFSFADACRFARVANMKTRLRCLYDYPDAKVRLSSRLFELSVPLFIAATRATSKGRSRLQKTDLDPFLAYFEERRS